METLIDRSRGDTVVDYRKGDEWVIQASLDAARAATGSSVVLHGIDAVCEGDSYRTVSKILADGGSITVLNPHLKWTDLPANQNMTTTYVGVLNANIMRDPLLREQEKKGLAICRKEFGLVCSRLFTAGLRDGWLVGHPYEVVPGGLNGVGRGLSALKDGKASGKKYIYRVTEV